MPTGKLAFRWCEDLDFRQCPYCQTVAHIDWWEDQLVAQWKRVQEAKMRVWGMDEHHPHRKLVEARARAGLPRMAKEVTGWTPQHGVAATGGGA